VGTHRRGRQWQIKRKPKATHKHFTVQLFEKDAAQTGIYFESADLGGQIPRAGDGMIAPLPKFGSDKTDKHFVFEVVGRYFFARPEQGSGERREAPG
jgi:hypothetical protein